LKVNPVALIESTYLFVRFAKEMYNLSEQNTTSIRFQIRVENLPEDKKLGLQRGLLWFRMNNLGYYDGDRIFIDKTVQQNELIIEEVAFQIVAEFYTKFGYEHDRVPLTKLENGRRIIDIEEIKKIN
jgi:hypothetical protein